MKKRIQRITLALFIASNGFVIMTSSAAEQTSEGFIYQTTSPFGEKLYTAATPDLHMSTEPVDRALVAAEQDYNRKMTVDSVTWYARMLGWKGQHRKVIEVLTTGLKKYPNSAKLLRHRAHRYLTLREFEKSIEDGLRSAELYEGQFPDRELPGPDYYPGFPGVVQYSTYYHLGQALFASRRFKDADGWFTKALGVALTGNDYDGVTSGVYWIFLSRMRAGKLVEAKKILDEYRYTMYDLRDSNESHAYFDGIQLFKEHRAPTSFFTPEQLLVTSSDRADLIAASNGYSIANYYLNKGEPEKAREFLKRSLQVDAWGLFARIQAEVDWLTLFGTDMADSKD